MPIFRIQNDLHFFAHVPKCGGSTVNAYMSGRFGPLGFSEPQGDLLPLHRQWNRTSNQHVPTFVLDRFVPPDWFTSSFAVVRHPLGRLVSAFFFARNLGLAPPGAEFNSWFHAAANRIEGHPFDYDGHLLPQSVFVPHRSRIFRFEDGFEPIIPYLDSLCGNQDGPRQLEARNIGTWRGTEGLPVPTAETLALIAQVYAEDFARFGYDIASDPAATRTAAALPASEVTGKPPEPARPGLGTRFRRYLIRKAHRPGQLSTLEATCAALAQLESDAGQFEPLLSAFDGFVAQQSGYRDRKSVV